MSNQGSEISLINGMIEKSISAMMKREGRFRIKMRL